MSWKFVFGVGLLLFSIALSFLNMEITGGVIGGSDIFLSRISSIILFIVGLVSLVFSLREDELRRKYEYESFGYI